MTAEQLAGVVAAHANWLYGREGGTRANLTLANAAFLCRAANSHAALLAACKGLVAQFADAYRDPCDLAALDDARAAIARAEGRP